MKRSVTVTVAGLKFQLRSDGDDASVQALAAEVDRRIRNIQKTSKAIDTQQLAVLAALQMAEELQAERAALASLKEQVRERSRTLLKLLERQTGV